MRLYEQDGCGTVAVVMPCCWHHQFASHNRMRIRNRSGFLPVGSLAVDTHPMITVHIIIPEAYGAGDIIPLMIPLSGIATKGKPITHTVIPITTIQVVHGIIQSRTITMVATGDIDDHAGRWRSSEFGSPLLFPDQNPPDAFLGSYPETSTGSSLPGLLPAKPWHLTLKQLAFLEAILNRPAP